MITLWSASRPCPNLEILPSPRDGGMTPSSGDAALVIGRDEGLPNTLPLDIRAALAGTVAEAADAEFAAALAAT